MNDMDLADILTGVSIVLLAVSSLALGIFYRLLKTRHNQLADEVEQMRKNFVHAAARDNAAHRRTQSSLGERIKRVTQRISAIEAYTNSRLHRLENSQKKHGL